MKVLYSININAAWSHFTDVSAEYSSETMQIKKKKKKTNFQEILADRLTIKYWIKYWTVLLERDTANIPVQVNMILRV